MSGIATILSSPVFFEKRIFEEQNKKDEIWTTEKNFLETTTSDKMDETVTITVERKTENSFLEPTTDVAAATTTKTTATTLKEESLPFCEEDPKSKVYSTNCDAL